jgi:hypothetical protein
MVFSQRTRIATFTWGAAYLSGSKIITVIDQGQFQKKDEVKKVASELGLRILPNFTSVRQRGTKGFVYKTERVDA